MGRDKDRKKEKKHKHKEKDKSKKRRRERSSSSDSGSDSDEHRKRQKAEKMAKKVAQYWDKQSAKGAAPAKFMWVKKVEKDLQAGKSVREFTVAAEAEKHRERMSEIEKVQKRREEKEAEKERMEEELALLERQRLAAEAADQEEQEEQFHLEQAMVRSDRRLAQGRARPIDYVARALYGLKGRGDAGHDDFQDDDDEDGDALAAEPYRIFDGILIEDLQELADDIRGFKELDVKDGLHTDFWGAMHVLAQEELAIAQRRDADDRALSRAGGGLAGASRLAAAAADGGGGGAAAGMPREVRQEIEVLLAGQTHAELRRMEGDINGSLAAGEGDPDYWEAVLERLQIHAARARLREIHADLLRRRIASATAKIDVAEVMGWAADAAADDDEDAAAARRAAVAAALAAAGTREEGGAEAEGMDVDEEGGAGAAAGAAGAAPGRVIVNDEEIALSDDEEEEGGEPRAAAAAADAEGNAGPSGRGEEGEEPPGKKAAGQQQFTGVGAAGGARDTRAQEAFEESDGRFSPPPVDPARLEPGAVVVAEEDDARTIALLRQEIKLKEAARYLAASETAARQLADAAADRAYQRQFASRSLAPVHPMLRNVAVPEAIGDAGAAGAAPARIGMGPVARQEEDPELRRLRQQAEKVMAGAAGEDEDGGGAPGIDLPFGGEVGLGVASQAYWWHNKYAPRKPKYFNRIHTGYEWNKYNQTHYDHDNPPPKVVQGYKFNIFYPDLIDKKTAPSYRVDPDPTGGKDTCILVFTAGAPYEDIAFRIVNKEWETTHRRGFKCTYDRGILHLYFNFKRARYRR
ncbi:MAG: cactus-binding C-terminus of cactin protein-domain-containing protein [Monoraphidium minutum]|nr:MAG: cactus-binding C-terminus of cactin protein-domain-containing protein [Monoraphidium minutum]